MKKQIRVALIVVGIISTYLLTGLAVSISDTFVKWGFFNWYLSIVVSILEIVLMIIILIKSHFLKTVYFVLCFLIYLSFLAYKQFYLEIGETTNFLWVKLIGLVVILVIYIIYLFKKNDFNRLDWVKLLFVTFQVLLAYMEIQVFDGRVNMTQYLWHQLVSLELLIVILVFEYRKRAKLKNRDDVIDEVLI